MGSRGGLEPGQHLGNGNSHENHRHETLGSKFRGSGQQCSRRSAHVCARAAKTGSLRDALQGVAGSNPVSPTEKPPLTCEDADQRRFVFLTFWPNAVMYASRMMRELASGRAVRTVRRLSLGLPLILSESRRGVCPGRVARGRAPNGHGGSSPATRSSSSDDPDNVQLELIVRSVWSSGRVRTTCIPKVRLCSRSRWASRMSSSW